MPVNEHSTFARNLRDARARAGLTQDELADRLGFARGTTISLWERADQPVPEPRTIVKLAEAIGCATADLLRNVVTPYDVLRGATLDTPAGEVLTPADREWLRLGRGIAVSNPDMRRAMVRVLTTYLKHHAEAIAPRPAARPAARPQPVAPSDVKPRAPRGSR